MNQVNTYDEFADQYAELVSQFDLENDPVIRPLLDVVGDVSGLAVLDAGCGEGLVSRLLAAGGAEVCGVDISKRLVEKARQQDPMGRIDYRVLDLSTPQEDLADRFDLVTSNLVLNDVPDYTGFVETVGGAVRSGGRVVATLNNPYSAVFREKASTYYASGEVVLYQGLSQAGVEVYHYHRMLEEYVDVFRENGFLLRTLKDLHPAPNHPNPVGWNTVPFIILLEFVKHPV